MSPEEHFVSIHGDYRQAERLVSAKKSNQSSPNTPVITSKNSSPNRAISQNPKNAIKSKIQDNIFVKSAVRNITPGSMRPYARKSPLLK